MRVLLLGKYPPIEGGVSGATFRAAGELAARGHEVHVITNANEVEIGFREFLWGNDSDRLQGTRGTGSVQVHCTTAMDGVSFIPWAEPYSSKLIGRALSVGKRTACDVVVGIYFEPFGLAAAIVAQILGRPLILRHAGSDIGRLADHCDLRPAYEWMLQQASVILTGPASLEPHRRLTALGVDPSRLRTLRAPALPDCFSDIGDELDLSGFIVAVRSSSHFLGCASPQTTEQIFELNGKQLQKDLTTIGAYGKVGLRKGSFALLRALQTLAERGCRFNFLTLAGGTVGILNEYWSTILQSPALSKNTWILPLVAPWRVPSFLRACDAICFLEQGFPIAFHKPRLPREVLAAGVCLVCSAEVADKQGFSSDLVSDKNYIRVEDTNDHERLCNQLERLIGEPDFVHSVARHGLFLSRTIEPRLSPE